ncbi:MAG: hypothetical protein V1875_01510 [Candidatus Altiarchaeota archaeon]
MKVGVLAYTDFVGLPVMVWGGIITLSLMLLTFAIGFLNKRGIRVIPFKYHGTAAYITLVAAILHGLMGVLSNLGL